MLPSQQQQDLLVNGFIKEHCRINIPIVLIKICFLYFNDIFYWKFKGEKLENLLSMKNTEEIESKEFTLKDNINI